MDTTTCSSTTLPTGLGSEQRVQVTGRLALLTLEGDGYLAGQCKSPTSTEMADRILFLFAASGPFAAPGTWYKVINTGSGFSYAGGGWAYWQTVVSDLNGDGRSDVLLFSPFSQAWYRAITTTQGSFTYTSGTFPSPG